MDVRVNNRGCRLPVAPVVGRNSLTPKYLGVKGLDVVWKILGDVLRSGDQGPILKVMVIVVLTYM